MSLDLPRRLQQLIHPVVIWAVVLTSLVGFVFPDRATYAGGYDPTLVLTSCEAFAVSNGNVAVKIRGTFSFDDLVQFSFPTGLIVTRTDKFVRYDLAGDVIQGVSPAVSNGVTADEIPALLAVGESAPAPAALGQIERESLLVTLPSDFAPGVASLVVYAVLDGDPFVSNMIDCPLP